jgi:ATP phosphoribosyltransferase
MINPNTDEVNTIHKLYISGASLQYEGFRALETSIIQKNARQFREANIKLKEGKEKINQFNEAISQLRIKHKVVSKKRDE